MSQDQQPRQQEEQEQQQQQQQQPTKRKHHDNPQSQSHVLHFTARNPPWTYLKLQLINHAPNQTTRPNDTPLDPVTTRTYLTAALSQFLGLAGTSISIDILKTPSSTSPEDNTVWIRVPRPDGAAVVAALSSWVGAGSSSGGNSGVAWRVCGKGNFLGALVAGDGRDLFVP